ncbi:unnamed protein product [Calypogeia fissa]
MDSGRHREAVVEDDSMPPLEEEPEDEEGVQHGDIPLEEHVSEAETDSPSEMIDFDSTAALHCDFCGRVFPSDSLSDVWRVQHQNKSSYHLCLKCESKFRNSTGMLQHLDYSKSHNVDYPHASFRAWTAAWTTVAVITVLVVLMGILAAYWGGRVW